MRFNFAKDRTKTVAYFSFHFIASRKGFFASAYLRCSSFLYIYRKLWIKKRLYRLTQTEIKCDWKKIWFAKLYDKLLNGQGQVCNMDGYLSFTYLYWEKTTASRLIDHQKIHVPCACAFTNLTHHWCIKRQKAHDKCVQNHHM